MSTILLIALVLWIKIDFDGREENKNVRDIPQKKSTQLTIF